MGVSRKSTPAIIQTNLLLGHYFSSVKGTNLSKSRISLIRNRHVNADYNSSGLTIMALLPGNTKKATTIFDHLVGIKLRTKKFAIVLPERTIFEMLACEEMWILSSVGVPCHVSLCKLVFERTGSKNVISRREIRLPNRRQKTFDFVGEGKKESKLYSLSSTKVWMGRKSMAFSTQ